MIDSILNFVLGSAPNAEPGSQPPLSHIEWAKHQRPISASIGAVAVVACNPAIHRCRIGKITLKQADKAV